MTTTVRRLTLEAARRIAVRAQLLDAERPADLAATIERLTLLQLDPTAAIAPNADLVSWSRLGDDYSPAHLQNALEVDRTVFEFRGQESDLEPIVVTLRPMTDLGLYLAHMAAWPFGSELVADWMSANDAFRRRVLDQLRDAGPLASRDIPDTSAVPWQSSGWTNDRNVTRMLEFLTSSGQIAVAGRRGRQRVFDLAERVFPPDVVTVPLDDAQRIRSARRLRSLGIARPQVVGDAGVPAEVAGTPGTWRLDPEASADGFAGRTALLSPFDRLIHHRQRMTDLFGFDYTLEMYKPAAKRRWGYFALPVLHHDRLVGKVDATADRKAGLLQVHAVHHDVSFTRAMTSAVAAELDALAQWLGLEVCVNP